MPDDDGRSQDDNRRLRDEDGACAMTVAVLVPAAGVGRRMGGARKPWLRLGGRPVLEWALAPFLARDDVVEVVVALSEDDMGSAGDCCIPGDDPRVHAVRGGRTRFESVAAALRALTSDAGVVAVHDGARPFPSATVLEECIALARTGVGAVAGIRAVDTIKRVTSDRTIRDTPPRASLWQAQTPQVFPRGLFQEAAARAVGGDGPADHDDGPSYTGARPSGCDQRIGGPTDGRGRLAGGRGRPTDGFGQRTGGSGQPTDDASMLERIGAKVRMVEAAATNLKITRPADLIVAEALIAGGLVPAEPWASSAR